MRISSCSNNYGVNSKGYHFDNTVIKVNNKEKSRLARFKCDIFSAIDTNCPSFQFPNYYANYSPEEKRAYMTRCLESQEIIKALGSKANDIDVYIKRSTSCSPNNSQETDCYFQTFGEMLNYIVSVPALKIEDALRPCYNMLVDKPARKITNVPINVEKHPQEALKMILGANLYDLAVSSPYNQSNLKLDR